MEVKRIVERYVVSLTLEPLGANIKTPESYPVARLVNNTSPPIERNQIAR